MERTTKSKRQHTFLVDPAAYEIVKNSTISAGMLSMAGSGYILMVGLRMLSVKLQKVGIRFMNIMIPVVLFLLVYTS